MHKAATLRTEEPGEVLLRQRYFELLKNTLCFSYWEEPGIPLDEVTRAMSAPVHFCVQGVQYLLSWFRLKLTYCRAGEGARERGQVWPAHGFTMVGRRRLDQLQLAIERVLQENVPGDLIETGVWRGGASILMRAVLEAYGDTHRRVWVADSFQGLPAPDPQHYPADAGDVHHRFTFGAVSEEEVRANFAKFGLLDSQVVFLKGWFKDTLPNIAANQFAIIRLDGDMYESTVQALENLYPKLAPGGFCIIDDYQLAGCRRAVEDYRQLHSIQTPLTDIDGSAVFWRKTV